MRHSFSHTLLPASMLLGSLFTLSACQEEPEPTPLAKEGEACQVAAECESGLTCRADVCTPLKVTEDMGPGSEMGTGTDMDVVPDMPASVESEEYVISFLRKINTGSEKNNTYLYAVNTKSEEVVRVSDDPNLCRYNCWLSDDLETFVYIQPKAAETTTFDVFATSVNADLTVDGSGTVIVPDAERVLFNGDAVSFMRGDETSKTAYYLKLGTTMEVPLAQLDQRAGDTQDSWAFDLATQRSVVFSPTLQKLSVRVKNIGGAITEENEVYTIDGSNYQMTSGAYFGTNIPSAISPDGRYLAVLTDAPNDYNICSTNAECDEMEGQHCGERGICTVRELTVRTFDLESLAELPNGSEQSGTQCNKDADCSTAHECYIPAPTQLDKARCIPRRVTLGLQGQLQQPRVGTVKKRGCEITVARDISRYTNINAPMTFGPDNMLYVAASRDCPAMVGERNMPDSDIIKINPEGGEISVVTGSAKQDFSADRCYDLTNNKVDITDCVVYIAQAVLSPLGNELALIATQPETQDASLAATKLDVWTVLKDGSEREWLGDGSIFDEARRVTTHAPK